MFQRHLFEAGQPRATASAADDMEGQGLDFMSERTPVLSDTTLRYLAIVDALALVGCVFARAKDFHSQGVSERLLPVQAANRPAHVSRLLDA
jgi:hypothetical protein